MKHSSHRGFRDGPAARAIAVLWLAVAVLRAESPIQIVTPENGLVVTAGGELTVTIKTPPSAFQSVAIVGDGPFVLSTGLKAPPYQYTYPIPASYACGRYRFKASGTTASGHTVFSEAVEVDIERSDKPKKLASEFQSLTLSDQENATLIIWGIFGDGSKVDLTRSSQMVYTSDRPSVAAVSSDGAVTGAGSGKAKITAKFGDKAIVIPIAVTAAK